MRTHYPIAQTIKDQCKYSPYWFYPLREPAKPIYMNMIGETQNNNDGNISYLFYQNDGAIWCRFGTYLHTPTESNDRMCTHNLIGDVRMTRQDIETMIVDLQRVLKNLDN